MARSRESAGVLPTPACMCQGNGSGRARSYFDALLSVCAILSVPPGSSRARNAVPVNQLGLHPPPVPACGPILSADASWWGMLVVAFGPGWPRTPAWRRPAAHCPTRQHTHPDV